MAMTKSDFLHIVRFVDLEKWSAHDAVFENMDNRFPLVPLSKVLKRVKEPVVIEDGTFYKRITVRHYGQGVLKRDELPGEKIGTKRQFLAHAGQLIISRIDARNGAFGIVPPELEGAIVTNDFWLFDVQNALSEYLMLVLSSEPFQKYWQTQSSGTTNRQRVSESSFLNTRIALPSITDQQVLLNKYNADMKKADESENQSKVLNDEIGSIILEYTNCSKSKKKSTNNALLKVKAFSKMINWGTKLNANNISPKDLFSSKQYRNVVLSSVAEVNPTTKYSEHIINEKITFLPMECISDVYGEISEMREGTVANAKGYTRFQENDILWAKITPCMQNGKCAIARHLENGYGYGSTEYHVIRANKEKVLPEYLYCFLRTRLVREVAQAYFSGSAGQQRVGADFLENLNIPLLPIRSDDKSQMTQETMVQQVFEVKAKIKALRKEAESLRQRAKKEFETAVFG